MNCRQATFRVAVRRFGPFESALARQWAAFDLTARTGLKLEIVPMDLHPLYDATIGAGAACDWDVVFLNTDWVSVADRCGVLLDLSPRLRDDPPDGFPDAWSPSMLGLQNRNGRILGLPYHDGPECLIYRTDLLAEAGEQVPETWDDFRRIARRLHAPDQSRYGTLFAAYPDGHNTVYDFCLQLWTRGGELTGPRGEFLFDSPQAMDALTFLREMINDSATVHPRCRQMDSVQSGMAFAAGEAALMVNWFGFAAMAETLPSSKTRGRVNIAPVPHAAGASGASLNIYWILGIPSAATHPDVAWQFLRHAASAEMDKLLTLEGAIGCRKSTWTDAEVNRAIPFYRRMEDLHAQARELPQMEEWPQVAQIIDRMVLSTIDTGEAIDAIARRAQSEARLLSIRNPHP